MTKKSTERIEALIRVPFFIIATLIMEIWSSLIIILALINLIIVLLTGKRNKNIAEFSEYFPSYQYQLMHYITFNTNERPFPFTPLKKLGKFEK